MSRREKERERKGLLKKKRQKSIMKIKLICLERIHRQIE